MATRSPALIRLVTARYRDMQGLRTIVEATLPFGLGLSLLVGRLASELADSLWPMALVFIPMAIWLWAKQTRIIRRIDAFYAERCGRVGGVLGLSAAVTYESAFVQAVVFLPILIQVGWPLWARIAIVLPLLTAQPLWTVVRDAPYRMHWLLPALVGFIAAFRLVDVRTSEQAFIWQMWVGIAGGLAIACAGALDHRLLLQTLHGGGDPAASTEQVTS